MSSSLHIVRDNEPKRAFLVSAQLPGVSDLENTLSLDELSRLVTTLGLKVVGRLTQKRTSHVGATVIGDGKLEELAQITGGVGLKGDEEDESSETSEQDDEEETYETRYMAGTTRPSTGRRVTFEESVGEDDEAAPEVYRTEPPAKRPEVVVFDCELTPSQIRNLEKALGCQVMDRTGVIIEIFSKHARSRAARLQIEIARLRYLAPRIREASGGGYDRQGGKGAGESAIELDRRKIRDRIKELKDEFVSIEKEHETRRARRAEVRCVALVGYTNAGKSSLMRAMTGSEVYVADKLFATLDTTVRPVHPATRPAILISDTVGFIKKLPHDLVASFRSTLDEALNASLLLYVVDSSDPSFRSQLEVTHAVLNEVGASEIQSRLVLNKIDRLSEEELAGLRGEFPDAVFLSTRSKEDLASLRDLLVEHFEGDMVDEEVFVPYNVQGVVGEIRERMRVIEESYEAEGVRYVLRARQADLARLRARFGI